MMLKRLAFKQYKLFNKVFLMDCRKLCSKSPVVDHYEVLGLSKNATQAEIKNAYFELSKIYHPDKISATDENLAKFRAISDAYEILGNEQSKKLYDSGLLKFGKDYISQPDDLSDPIIRLFKERQMRAKEIIKPAAVSTEYYKTLKVKTFYENEFYKYTYSKKGEELNFAQTILFLYTALFLLSFCIVAHQENSPLYNEVKQILITLKLI